MLIFEKANLGNTLLKNKIIRSATFTNGWENDTPTNKLLDVYDTLVNNHIGLIIAEAVAVEKRGRGFISQATIDLNNKDQINSFKKLAEIGHRNDTKIYLQLNHVGRHTNSSNNGGSIPVTSSGTFNTLTSSEIKELTYEEIIKIANKFAEASLFSREAGFDGIQLHGASGYLIHQFYSPLYNQRKDEFGGNSDKRLNFLYLIIEKIQNKVGKDFPVIIKLNVHDYSESGIKPDECLYICNKLKAKGIKAVELTSNTLDTAINTPQYKKQTIAYNLEFTEKIRKELQLPLILVGGIKSSKLAEELISSNKTDFVSICRGFICEPDLIYKWKINNDYEGKCSYCNQCLKNIFTNPVFLQCYQK